MEKNVGFKQSHIQKHLLQSQLEMETMTNPLENPSPTI